MMVIVAFLVGCGGGETSYGGTYKMVLKKGEKAMTLTLELNPDKYIRRHQFRGKV